MIFLLVFALLPIYSNESVKAAVQSSYFVSTSGNDLNPGSKEHPWKTIQKAANTLVAGDTVFVRGGIYSEFVQIKNKGTKDAGPITFSAYPGEKPIIDGTNLTMGSGKSALLYLSNASYVTVDGFELRNLTSKSSSHYPAGIRIREGGQHIQLLNNNVHDISVPLSGGNGHGIHVYGNSSSSIRNIIIRNNEVHHLNTGRSEALTLSGNIDGFTVDHNQVHDNNNIGIDIAGFYGACTNCIDQARNGVVTDNLVYNNSSVKNPAYGGVYAAGGIYADGATNVVIERNISYGNDFGIELASENKGKQTSNIIVRNNLIRHNNAAGIIMGGASSANGGSTKNLILNNSLIENDQLNQGYGEITLQWNNVDNQILNNILVNKSNKVFVQKNNTSGSGNTVDYNLLFSSIKQDSTHWKWQGTSYSSWDLYQKATGHDSHSIFANPKFASPDEFNYRLLNNSPGLNIGKTLANSVGVFDLVSNTRIQGSAIDIGAYENQAGFVPLKDTFTTPSKVIPIAVPDSIVKQNTSVDWSKISTLSKSATKSLKASKDDISLYLKVEGSMLNQKGQFYLNT
ncbi:MAG: right-handed parallel beta-helix repeat-containing protein, partial [Melioribacteraceae bacterium]|nr:right-handed parallel beta-helix repeat-containing protein [Melioribacteraceae bacterium]